MNKIFSVNCDYLLNPSIIKFVLGAQNYRLIEMVLLSTHKIFLGR